MICVYTAITGEYELPKNDQKWGEAEWYFYGENKEGKWKQLKVTNQFKDPRLNARFHKILPQFDCDYTIWIDGSITLNVTPEELVANLGDCDILTHKHPVRNCIYEEAAEVLRKQLDYKENVDKQIKRLIKKDYPSENGLAETKIVVRRTKTTEQFNKEWWYQLITGSSRDQLSFNSSAWETGTKIKLIDLSPLFTQVKHLRRVYQEK